MLGMDQRIAALTDKELESYHANAVRVAQSGASRQREEAERLLPVLGAAMEERRLARVAAQAQARRENTERRALARKAAREEGQ
jgi:hypothetical protein